MTDDDYERYEAAIDEPDSLTWTCRDCGEWNPRNADICQWCQGGGDA